MIVSNSVRHTVYLIYRSIQTVLCVLFTMRVALSIFRASAHIKITHKLLKKKYLNEDATMIMYSKFK